jgi:hypothetical protein
MIVAARMAKSPSHRRSIRFAAAAGAVLAGAGRRVLAGAAGEAFA